MRHACKRCSSVGMGPVATILNFGVTRNRTKSLWSRCSKESGDGELPFTSPLSMFNRVLCKTLKRVSNSSFTHCLQQLANGLGLFHHPSFITNILGFAHLQLVELFQLLLSFSTDCVSRSPVTHVSFSSHSVETLSFIFCLPKCRNLEHFFLRYFSSFTACPFLRAKSRSWCLPKCLCKLSRLWYVCWSSGFPFSNLDHLMYSKNCMHQKQLKFGIPGDR